MSSSDRTDSLKRAAGRVTVLRGDITRQAVDAVVNAAKPGGAVHGYNE